MCYNLFKYNTVCDAYISLLSLFFLLSTMGIKTPQRIVAFSHSSRSGSRFIDNLILAFAFFASFGLIFFGNTSIGEYYLSLIPVMLICIPLLTLAVFSIRYRKIMVQTNPAQPYFNSLVKRAVLILVAGFFISAFSIIGLNVLPPLGEGDLSGLRTYCLPGLFLGFFMIALSCLLLIRSMPLLASENTLTRRQFLTWWALWLPVALILMRLLGFL
jgi:hypothetical protein